MLDLTHHVDPRVADKAEEVVKLARAVRAEDGASVAKSKTIEDLLKESGRI